jgi:hypothetical protein
MKLNGSLHGFTPRQRFGKGSWTMLDRLRFLVIKHMHLLRCTHGRSFLKVLGKHYFQYYRVK